MSGGRGCFNCGGCAWCFLCCFVDIYSIQRPKSCCSQSVTDLGGSPYARRKLAFTFCLPTFFFCVRVCGADVDRYLVLFPLFIFYIDIAMSADMWAYVKCHLTLAIQPHPLHQCLENRTS